jgi:hypothetical protein
VIIPDDLMQKMPQDELEALVQVLSQDPRPAYQEDPERVYGMTFGAYEVKFCVQNGKLFVRSAEKY